MTSRQSLPSEPFDYLKEINFKTLTQHCYGSIIEWDGTTRVCLLWVVALLTLYKDLTIAKDDLPVMDEESFADNNYWGYLLNTVPKLKKHFMLADTAAMLIEIEGTIADLDAIIGNLQIDLRRYINESFAVPLTEQSTSNRESKLDT